MSKLLTNLMLAMEISWFFVFELRFSPQLLIWSLSAVIVDAFCARKVSEATNIVDLKQSLRKSNAKVKVEAMQNRWLAYETTFKWNMHIT